MLIQSDDIAVWQFQIRLFRGRQVSHVNVKLGAAGHECVARCQMPARAYVAGCAHGGKFKGGFARPVKVQKVRQRLRIGFA